MKTPRLLLLFLWTSLWLSPLAHGQADFFAGKQIKIVVGFRPAASSISGRGCSPSISANIFPATRLWSCRISPAAVR